MLNKLGDKMRLCQNQYVYDLFEITKQTTSLIGNLFGTLQKITQTDVDIFYLWAKLCYYFFLFSPRISIRLSARVVIS